MKTEYSDLLQLDQETIESGIFNVYQNVLDLNESAELLANSEKYSLAVALKLLSIEEIIKMHSLFIFRLGIRDQDAINYGLKKIKEHSNVHQTRLKYASMMSSIPNVNKIFDLKGQLEPLLKERFSTIKIDSKLTIDGLVELILDRIPNLKDELNVKQLLIGREAKIAEIENEKNWLSEAQSIKEKAFYVDRSNTGWSIPRDISKFDYEQAQTYHKQMMDNELTQMIMDLNSNDVIHRKIILGLLSGIIKQFPIDYHTW